MVKSLYCQTRQLDAHAPRDSQPFGHLDGTLSAAALSPTTAPQNTLSRCFRSPLPPSPSRPRRSSRARPRAPSMSRWASASSTRPPLVSAAPSARDRHTRHVRAASGDGPAWVRWSAACARPACRDASFSTRCSILRGWPSASAFAAPSFNRFLSDTRAACCSASFFCLFFSPPGNTETVAGYISAATGIDAQDIGDVGAGIADFDGIICGAPTWHTGADTERSGTVWDEFIYGELEGLDLKGKKVAIFGLGDSGGYGDNFCDAMDELATCFKARGADIIGSVSTDGYEFEESKSVAGGKFVGLACDEDNQPDMSEERVGAWISQLKSEGMPL